MKLSDLKQGMYLTNDSKLSINLYLNSWTGKEENQFLTIDSGAVIGQIIDFVDSDQGPAVVFYSPKIKSASASVLGLNTEYYLLGWLSDKALPAAWIPWKQLQPAVSDTQVHEQEDAFAKNEADGNTFKNQIKNLASEAGEAAGGAASGLLGGLGKNLWGWGLFAGGIWLISRSKTVRNL